MAKQVGSDHHPTPWRVEYWQRFETWHEKSMPHVVDANGDRVIVMPQNENHPGMYDEKADATAHRIVENMNGP